MTNRIAKSAFYNILYTAQNALFPLITAGHLSRVLAPEGIGQVAYARNIVSYFTMFSLLGIPQYGMREIARSGENTDRLFSELAILGAVVSAICAAACFGFARWRLPGDTVLLYLSLETVFQGLNIEWLYRGKEDFGFLARWGLAEKLLTLALVVTFVRNAGDLPRYCLLSCLVKGFGYLWGILRARKYVRLTLRDLSIRRHFAPVLTMMLGSAAASLYSKVDITMLGILANDCSVGYYANAHKVVNIVIALSVAVSGIFLPRLSRTYGTAAYSKDVSLGLKTVLLPALPCCVGLMLVAEDVTEVLFGAGFAPAAETLGLLAPLILVKGVGDILCYQTLLSAGQEQKLPAAYLLAGAGNIGLNAVLIPRYGHNGAAAASLISELTVNLVLLRTASSIVKPRLDGHFIASLLTGTVAMTGSVLAVRQMAAGLPRLVSSVAAGALAYFGTVLLIIAVRKRRDYA